MMSTSMSTENKNKTKKHRLGGNALSAEERVLRFVYTNPRGVTPGQVSKALNMSNSHSAGHMLRRCFNKQLITREKVQYYDQGICVKYHIYYLIGIKSGVEVS